MDEIKLVEHNHDVLGGYETHWLCDPPVAGTGYYVREEEWSEDFHVRTIKRVELVLGEVVE